MMLIRYPGSKAKLAGEIVSMFPEEFQFPLWADRERSTYIEPFFGAGAIGFHIIKSLPNRASVVINDLDVGIYALWSTVLKHPKELQKRIALFRPTAEAFYEFKAADGSLDGGIVECGFRKLALHQMSVSGFGAMSGGPLGGRDQRNAAYPVDCRWNAERLQRHVRDAHKMLRRLASVEIRNEDFATCLSRATSESFVYADPPYVEKGPQLYKHSMTDADHARLAQCLKSLPCRWVLSYDDHPLVRSLFSDCAVKEIDVKYSNAVTKEVSRPKNREVVITAL